MPFEDASVWLLIAAALGVVAAVCWPRHGLIAWRARRCAELRQARVDDVLKHLCKTEADGRRPTLASVAGVLRVDAARAAALLEEMATSGLVEFSSGEIRPTPQGRQAGTHIIRAHRLWECYLADETGLRESEWHAQAELREHRMTPAEADELSVRLGNPTIDPHGDPIPAAGGRLEGEKHRPLASLRDGESAVLAHIEDEPEGLYQRLAAHGLRVGMTVRMLEQSEGAVRFIADGETLTLEAILVNQLEVGPLPASGASGGNLAACPVGSRATVRGLAQACRGHERRRLLDLGFVAGTEVEVAMTSPSGEPTAYLVRGALIALHREQARQIIVEPGAQPA
ncbi:MAG: metal-dependent transcriptional regulator [Akkermansiaceae bacterium]|nr:metal-dependent transcriptional regulator [Akkermansiaceae bacterium]